MAITISEDLLRHLAPVREVGAHKGGVGGVMILAGAPHYPGAAWLAARAAGRSGAGIVYLAAPRSVINIMASVMPEVAFVPLPESESISGARRAIERMDEKLDRVTAFVIGPGLGDDDSTDHLLSLLFGLGDSGNSAITGFGFGADIPSAQSSTSLFTKTDDMIVVDADGLNWLAKQSEWWTKVPPKRLILTPHPMEANRLSGIPVKDIVADPAGRAEELAKRWNQIVVIKSGHAAGSDGEQTILSDLAPTSLATAGSGDTLAGSLGSYLSQGCAPLDAIALAIGIGCRAAAQLEKTYSVAGVIASDLPDMMAIELGKIINADESGES